MQPSWLIAMDRSQCHEIAQPPFQVIYISGHQHIHSWGSKVHKLIMCCLKKSFILSVQAVPAVQSAHNQTRLVSPDVFHSLSGDRDLPMAPAALSHPSGVACENVNWCKRLQPIF